MLFSIIILILYIHKRNNLVGIKTMIVLYEKLWFLNMSFYKNQQLYLIKNHLSKAFN